MNQAQTEAPLKRTFRGSRDALIQKTIDEPDLSWRVLVTLNAFRLLTSVALLGIFFAKSDPRFFGHANPTLYLATTTSYLAFAILSGISLRRRWVPVNVLGSGLVVVDITVIVTLMHASSGISSGIGGLLIIFVGAGSLVLQPVIQRLWRLLRPLRFLDSRFLRRSSERLLQAITRQRAF